MTHALQLPASLLASLATASLVDTLVHAFNPLVCTAEVYDYQKQLRYRVFNPADGTAVVSVFGVLLNSILDHEGLSAEIDKTRGRLEQQGFVLDSRTWLS
jgi:hypothetical protein